jgi:tetratricopeptide (TPR) repeat protein
MEYRAAVLAGFLSFTALPALAQFFGPAPDGDPKVVARSVISLDFDPPDCPSVARAARLEDGSIIAACSNGETFRIFALQDKQLALRCSAADHLGIPCSVEPKTSAAPVTTSATRSAYTKGMDALDRGDFDAAIAEFTAAITKDPRDPFSYIRRATAYEKKRANALAIADYRKVLTLVDEDTGTEFAAKIRKLEMTKVGVPDPRKPPARPARNLRAAEPVDE